MFFTSWDHAGAERNISKAEPIIVLVNFIVHSSAGAAERYCALNTDDPKESFFTLLSYKV
jgi:hypothetical protein